MPIFQDDGRPLAFHLDDSIRLPGARRRIEADIKDHGGTVVKKRDDADFSLVDEYHLLGGRTLQSLRQAFGISLPNLRIRTHNFVQACIQHGAIFVPVIVRKAMGGVPPRGHRTEFTHKDDSNLAKYLATVVPNPASGGRTGNVIYNMLCSNPDFPWAERHPPQSWRTRYKNRREWFDGKIADIVRVRPANPEALHVEDRTLNRQRYNSVRLYRDFSAPDDGEEEGEVIKLPESDATLLREEEEEPTDEERDSPDNSQTPLSPSFRPRPVNTQRTEDTLGKRARRPRDSTQSEQISQQELAALGKRARRHTGGDESPQKRPRVQEDGDDELRAPQDAIDLHANVKNDTEYLFDADFALDREFDPEPGPSNTQRTLVDYSLPSIEVLDPKEGLSTPAGSPRSSQDATAPRLPRASQRTLVGSTPRPQPSRKGKERMIHFDSEDDGDLDGDLFGDPSLPVRETEAVISNASPSSTKGSLDGRESQPPDAAEEPNHSDDGSMDDLFDQTGYDILYEPQYPPAETQDEEQDVEDLEDGSMDDIFDQPGYDMLHESQYPAAETQDEEQDIEDLLLGDPTNSSTRSPVAEVEHTTASRLEVSSEGSDDEQSLDTDDRQIDALRKASRSLSASSRLSSFEPNDEATSRDSPEQSQPGSDLDSDDAQVRHTIQRSATPISPAISATSSLGMSPIADTEVHTAVQGVLNPSRSQPSTGNRNASRSMEWNFRPPPSDASEEDVEPSPGIRARLRSAKTQQVNPTTPKRASVPSDSSIDNVIPSPFTRAWRVKQELDQAAKHQPYEPPPGTRAARVRSQRRL